MYNSFPETVTYIKGPRQFPQLIIKNFKYVKHRSGHGVTYWKCHLYDAGYCKARCIIGMDQTIILSGLHTHNPIIEHDRVIISHETFRIRRNRTRYSSTLQNCTIYK